MGFTVVDDRIAAIDPDRIASLDLAFLS